MTNRELNVKLATLLGLELDESLTSAFVMTSDSIIRIAPGLDLEDHGDIAIDGEFVNYCTTWGDIMPVAIELGINLIRDGEGGYYADEGWLHHSLSLMDDDISSNDSDPRIALVLSAIKKLEAAK